MTIQAIHHPCTWDNHCSVVGALRHGCCLRRDRGRERETEWMTTFVWCPAKKFGGKKWRQNNPGSIRFYCDMKPTSKTMVPWLVRTTLSVWNFLTWLLPSSVSEVGLIGRRVSLLLNCIKKSVSHRNTRNLFYLSMGATYSMHLM
jgi:hypothetical protein